MTTFSAPMTIGTAKSAKKGEIFSTGVTGKSDPLSAINLAESKIYSTHDKGVVVFGSKSQSVVSCPEKIWAATFVSDLETLSKTDLRRAYPQEANTHKNLLSRSKAKGVSVHPDFKLFRSFLRHVGPAPTASATLDRINNHDPEYAPNKVRWADRSRSEREQGRQPHHL